MNLAIIGCGNNGFRHFQSIAKSKKKYLLYLVDSSTSSLNKCKNYLNENPNTNLNVIFIKNINQIEFNVDIVIVSTTAKPRRSIIEEIYKRHNPKYFILEKFLFPKIEDYKFCEKLFLKNKTKTWVNQWMSNEFKYIKKYFPSNKKLHFVVSGNNWGLCCNSVHFIEWFHDLINKEEINIDDIKLENQLYETNRKNYFELFGSYKLISKNGHSLVISCDRNKLITNTDRQIFINISNNDFDLQAELTQSSLDYSIVEKKRKILLSNKLPNSYQSERTLGIIENLINFDKCNLVDYKTSTEHHLIAHDLFKDIFISNGFDRYSGIAIT